MICEYGCDQEAKFYLRFKVESNKWCCSRFPCQCPEVRRKNSESSKGKTYIERYGREKTKKIINKKRRAMKGRVFSKELRKKLSRNHVDVSGSRNPNFLSISRIKKKYPFFSQIEEMRYNPDKPGEKEIQVHCKNHLCPNSEEQDGWFTPTAKQFKDRKDCLENEGEDRSYFYCSESCKEVCPLYRLRSDPFKESSIPYTETEKQLWRQKVLEREDNICEYCGEKATIGHHEKPVKTHPHLALDPDNGIACCEKCHYKYGHKTGTECSTANLANKVCLRN